MLQDTSSVDVAIIGAGIIGSAAAALLAEKGLSVAVFEGSAVAAGASGRNLGTILHPMDATLAPLYAPTLAAYRQLSADFPGEFALQAEPSGLLMLTEDEKAARDISTGVTASYPELEPRVVDASGLEPALVPGLHGCLLKTAYPAEPASATFAFAARARRAGARFEIGGEAELVVRNGRAVGVRVGSERVTAGSVLVAAGHRTPEVVDPTGAWKPITPLWGVTAQVDLDGPLPRTSLTETFPKDKEAAAEMFMLTTVETVKGTTSTALGATFHLNEPDPAEFVPQMLKRGARFVPGLSGARVTQTRTCARPVSRDGAPLLGPLPGIEGLYVASGHGPWGISLGPASAQLTVDAILGTADVPSPYAAARFS